MCDCICICIKPAIHSSDIFKAEKFYCLRKLSRRGCGWKLWCLKKTASLIGSTKCRTHPNFSTVFNSNTVTVSSSWASLTVRILRHKIEKDWERSQYQVHWKLLVSVSEYSSPHCLFVNRETAILSSSPACNTTPALTLATQVGLILGAPEDPPLSVWSLWSDIQIIASYPTLKEILLIFPITIHPDFQACLTQGSLESWNILLFFEIKQFHRMSQYLSQIWRDTGWVGIVTDRLLELFISILKCDEMLGRLSWNCHRSSPGTFIWSVARYWVGWVGTVTDRLQDVFTYLIFVIFSPPTQFFTKIFSTQKRAKTDLTKTA